MHIKQIEMCNYVYHQILHFLFSFPHILGLNVKMVSMIFMFIKNTHGLLESHKIRL
jgi:hypothetical protein